MKVSRRSTFFILFSLLLLAGTSGVLRSLIAFALDTENTHASQIVLIPFISAMLIYMNRQTIFRDARYSVGPGLLFTFLGIGLLAFGMTKGGNLEHGDYLALLTSGIVIVFHGGFLLFYGPTAFRIAAFPLLFLVFFIPIPSAILNRTISLLQHGSADMAYIILRLSGTPILRESDFIFRLPDLVVEVAPQCSGIRSGISILIFSLLAGHLFLRTTSRRVVLVLAGLPILIFKNALRIATLSYLAVHVDKRILSSELHREGGIPFFILGLVLLYPILKMLIKSEGKSKGNTPVTSVTLNPVTVSDTKFGHY